jgi:hypothetical protein
MKPMKRHPGAGRILAAAGAFALSLGPAVRPVHSDFQSGPIREIRVRMSVGGTASEGQRFLPFRPESARMEIRERRTVPGNLPRQRRPELSEDLLVIVAVNTRGEEIYRTSQPDPRLLRAETADEAGRLTSTLLYLENVDFWVALPDDPDLDKIVFFHPLWTGVVFNLVPIGEVRLR